MGNQDAVSPRSLLPADPSPPKQDAWTGAEHGRWDWWPAWDWLPTQGHPAWRPLYHLSTPQGTTWGLKAQVKLQRCREPPTERPAKKRCFQGRAVSQVRHGVGVDVSSACLPSSSSRWIFRLAFPSNPAASRTHKPNRKEQGYTRHTPHCLTCLTHPHAASGPRVACSDCRLTTRSHR